MTRILAFLSRLRSRLILSLSKGPVSSPSYPEPHGSAKAGYGTSLRG